MTTIANERPGTPLWTILWSALAVVAGVLLFVVQTPAWLSADPASLALPITPTMNAAMTAFVEFAGPTFRALSDILDIPMRGVRWLLGVLPWAVTFWLAIVLAWRAGGLRVALFTAATLTYMLVVGYWAESMNSLALVVVSVPSAVLVGFAFGTLAFYSPAARRPIRTMLDVLQTIPAFAYLLPILLLFGFGTVVGLIASVLFAFPPMVRNTLLGLERVPEDIVEAGRMSGATSTQLFWQVRVPAAERQLLLGVNQTTMAAFSMVIIASIIGGTADIGWEVLSKMRKAEFGESLLAGIVIALMAMVMDRITTAFVQRSGGASARTMTRPAAVPEMLWAHRGVALAVVGGALVYALSAVAPALATWPEAWEIYPASYLNSAVEALTLNYAAAIATIKQTAFFFVMLPLKIGLAQTISPFSWGFEFTPALKLGYGVLAAMISALVAWRFSLRAGAVTAFGAIVLFAGLTKLPWPITVGAFVLLAGQLGGWRLALGTALGLIFLVFAGVWPQTMLSLYLCGLAVAIAFALGTALGVAAAEFKSVSAFLRPINDTLQTMPLFVLLIPFVMIFKIGEFTALLAIIAYAIVPAIRYGEAGLRDVSGDVVEAATSMGATRWQLLWNVKLPLAWPVLMLGLNQTIMYAIAMLVIAALVGTNGLGQQVYIGLGDADFGVGMVAGIGMAIIAIIADRMTQAASRSRGASDREPLAA